MLPRHSVRRVLSVGTLILACGVAGCGSKAAPAPQVRPVRSILVTMSGAAGTQSYTAEIRSRHETDLSFQVGGKLVSRAVDVGAMVRAGTPLAQIDPVDQRVNVDAARSTVNAARAELERARADEARYRDLLERGLTTRASYLAQQTAVRTGQSRLDQASADLRLSEQRLAYTTLRADVDGIVTRVYAEGGAVVSAGQKIISIARPSELEATFDVPDAHIEAIRATRSVRVGLLANAVAGYPAQIREISPSADPVTRTYQVKATIQNAPATLRLGMSVIVAVDGTRADSMIELPSTALFQKQREPAVWIVKPDQTLELRAVQVARYESDVVVVSRGVATGERVVTAGVHRLAAGDKVRLLAGTQP